MTAAKRLQKYLSIDRIKKLHDAAKTAFESRGPFAHNWDHTYRDTINAIWIGEVEGADMNIVIPAILLHDIGFLYDPDPYSHHLIGCEKSHAWLPIGVQPKAKRLRCVSRATRADSRDLK